LTANLTANAAEKGGMWRTEVDVALPLTCTCGLRRTDMEYPDRVRKPTLYPLSYGGRTV